MAEKEYFVENPAGIQHVFRSWNGPVGRHIDRKVRTLAVRARATAPKDTGALVSRISVVEGHRGKDLEALVGTNPKGIQRGYGYWQHEGTLPHEIRASHGHVLRFMIAGRVVFVHRVVHPGFRATHFLTRWLRDVVR